VEGHIDIRIAATRSVSEVDVIVSIVVEALRASLRPNRFPAFSYEVQFIAGARILKASHHEPMISVAIDGSIAASILSGRDLYGKISFLLAVRTKIPADGLVLAVPSLPPSRRRSDQAETGRGITGVREPARSIQASWRSGSVQRSQDDPAV